MAGIPSYKENLEHHYKTLLDNLDHRPIVEIMVAQGKINRTEKRLLSTAADEKHERSIFLDILLDKEDDSVDVFVAALYETGQDHLASVMEGKGKELLMTQEHVDLLTRNRHILVRDMDFSFVLECLQSDLVFTVEDAHTVHACPTPSSKNTCLLDILERKADAAFTSLVQGLRRSGQNHLADLLHTRPSSPIKELSRRRRQMSPPKGEQVLWRFEERIGKGGFGFVFKCLKTDTKQTYAVKVIETRGTTLENEHLHKIKNEVKILSHLKHPRIVRFIDSWDDPNEGKLYIAMEYMAKGPLAQYIQQNHPLEENQVACFTAQILQGLGFLHQKKIIHRDVKGSNILMDSLDKVKIADFGTAKALQGLTTCSTYRPDSSTKTTVGTFHWMAPEVFDEEATYTYSADVWSLGCTVVEMFTKYPPSHKLSQQQLLMNLVFKRQHPQYQIQQEISPSVEEFLKQCFIFDPEKRESVTDLLVHPFCASYREHVKEPEAKDKQGGVPAPIADAVTDGTTSHMKELRISRETSRTEAAASRPVRLQQPSLELTLNTLQQQMWDVYGMLGVEGGCIVGCKGRAVKLDSKGKVVGQYRAGDEECAVCNMCVYKNNLFLIQNQSVTVHVMNEYDSPSASGGGRAAGGGQQGGRGRCYQVPGVGELRGGVATGPDTLVLVDRGGEVVVWTMGEASTRRLVSGLAGPCSICTQDQAGDVSYIVTSLWGHCVQVYTATGRLLHTIGREGQGDGHLWGPQDAAVTEEGTVLVADNHRLCEFHQDGRYIRTLLTRQQLAGWPCRISLCPPYMWVNVDYNKILKYKLYSS